MKNANFKKYPFIIFKKNINSLRFKKISNYKDWTKEEDDLLIYITNNIGSKWKFISKYFPKRNIYEVYNRYFRINPSLKKGRFSKEEDEIIIESLKTFGKNWAKIAKLLTNRTSKQIRSRFVNKLQTLLVFNDINLTLM